MPSSGAIATGNTTASLRSPTRANSPALTTRNHSIGSDRLAASSRQTPLGMGGKMSLAPCRSRQSAASAGVR